MESTAVDDVAFALESRLMSDGIYVQSVDVPPDDAASEEATYRMRYESAATAESGVVPHNEVGTVINMFRELHDDDWRGADIEAVVTDLDGNVLAKWHVEQTWLEALEHGDLSEVDFSAKVIDSIEPTRE